MLALASCDHGFAPPEEPPTGVVLAEITYVDHPEAWPPDDELRELLFVAMRFVPKDTTDFLQLSRMIFSDRLELRVPNQRVVVSDVPTGPYLYAGVAQKYGPDPFDWRPVGLVEENGGAFFVAPGETTRVTVSVDFRNPPRFPPSE